MRGVTQRLLGGHLADGLGAGRVGALGLEAVGGCRAESFEIGTLAQS